MFMALQVAPLIKRRTGMGHLNHLQDDIAEMLDLTRKIENYDATLAAMQAAGR